MERILIVDPDEEVLKDIQLILQTHKYKTSIFTSVEKAISELPNVKPFKEEKELILNLK